jgi:hypothetical protein
MFAVVRITDDQGGWACLMHIDDRNSFCRGLASASSSDDVEPLKGPFFCSRAKLSSYRLSGWHGSVFFLAAAQRTSLQLPGVLPCSGSAGEPSVVTGWHSRLAAELFSSRERVATDERWWCWRSLVELVATLLLIDLMFTCCKCLRESC